MGWWAERKADQRARVLAAVRAHAGERRLNVVRRCAGVGWYAFMLHASELRADREIWVGENGAYYPDVFTRS